MLTVRCLTVLTMVTAQFEAGFHTQVPPLPLFVPVSGGVTTIGGLLGTDGVTRHVDNVLAKACSLEEEGLSCIFEMLDMCPYLARHIIATHINRSPLAFDHAKELARRGGFMDVSSGLNAQTLGPDCLKPSEAIAAALKDGVPPEHILMSSDGFGSAARYDDKGNVSGLVASDLHTLAAEFRDLVQAEKVDFEQALGVVCSNVAKAFSLYPQKGTAVPAADADLVVWDRDLKPHTVLARGVCMMKEKQLLARGTFEA